MTAYPKHTQSIARSNILQNGTASPHPNPFPLPPSPPRTPLHPSNKPDTAPKAFCPVRPPKNHTFGYRNTKSGLKRTRPDTAGRAIRTIRAGATDICVVIGAVQSWYGNDGGRESTIECAESGYESSGGIWAGGGESLMGGMVRGAGWDICTIRREGLGTLRH